MQQAHKKLFLFENSYFHLASMILYISLRSSKICGGHGIDNRLGKAAPFGYYTTVNAVVKCRCTLHLLVQYYSLHGSICLVIGIFGLLRCSIVFACIRLILQSRLHRNKKLKQFISAEHGTQTMPYHGPRHHCDLQQLILMLASRIQLCQETFVVHRHKICNQQKNIQKNK